MSSFLWFLLGFFIGQAFTAAFILGWQFIRPDRPQRNTQGRTP